MIDCSKLLADIAMRLAGQDPFDDRMQAVLGSVGRFLGISRCYVFMDNPVTDTTNNTHEWCAPEVVPQRGQLQGISYAAIPGWREMLDGKGQILADDISMFPDDVRNILEPQGIKSILVLPLFMENVRAGFIGFDDCAAQRTWSSEEISLLRTVTGIVSAVMERDREREQLCRSEANFRLFFDTVDDLIVVGDANGCIVYTNAAVRRRLGYSEQELTGKPILMLHPPDKCDEAGRIVDAMLKCERDTCPLELLRKDGTRMPVETRIWRGLWDGEECLFGISKSLQEEQERLQLFTRLFDENPNPMALSNPDDGRFINVNESFLHKLGYERSEVIGKTSMELGMFVDPAQRTAMRSALLSSGRFRDREVLIRRRDSQVLDGLFSGGLLDNQGTRMLLTVMIDISEQTSLRARLESQMVRLNSIIEATRLGTWEWHVQTGETAFNEEWAAIAGYSLAELAPVTIDTWNRLLLPEDAERSREILQRHFRGEVDHYEIEARIRRRDGHTVWVLDKGRVVQRAEDGTPLLMFGTHQDITERKLLEERLHEIAIRDPLTGIFNRRHLFERLEAVISDFARNGREFTVSMIDLDHFKSINDRLGHAVGDTVLRGFSEFISKNIRNYDIFGRYGGEEFLLVSVGANANHVAGTMERIMEELRQITFMHDNVAISCGFSCGIVESSEFTGETLNADVIIEKADSRLYKAKKLGRGRVVGPG